MMSRTEPRLERAERRAIRALLVTSLSLSMAGCEGTIAGSSPDRGPVQDSGTGDAPRDSAADASDSSPPSVDGGGYVEGSIGPYPGPPLDAAKFDGCVAASCTAGQLCVSVLGIDETAFAVCHPLPVGCGAPPSCPCIDQAAWWCATPKCAADGGFTLTCAVGGPP